MNLFDCSQVKLVLAMVSYSGLDWYWRSPSEYLSPPLDALWMIHVFHFLSNIFFSIFIFPHQSQLSQIRTYNDSWTNSYCKWSPFLKSTISQNLRWPAQNDCTPFKLYIWRITWVYFTTQPIIAPCKALLWNCLNNNITQGDGDFSWWRMNQSLLKVDSCPVMFWVSGLIF